MALSNRFQEAIDNAAMACGLIGSDEYTNAFVWSEPVEAPGTPQEVAAAIAAKIEAETDTVDWQTTVKRVKGD